MPRERETRIWADLALLLGRESYTLRQAAEKMGIDFHRADYYRKQLRQKGFLTHLGGGAYDITGKGEDFVVRWGRRETSERLQNETSEATVTLNLWEVHNSRFTLPVLREPAHLPKPGRLLGGRTPIITFDIRPLHPQDPSLEVPATLELWGKVPKTARFYLGTFPILGTWTKILVVQEDVARAAIREAKEEAGVALPRTPSPEQWHEDSWAAGSSDPLPSGHARLMLPEFQGLIQKLLKTGPTSWMDNSPSPGFETPDPPLIDQADRLFQALRLGKYPEELETQKEAIASHGQAILALLRRVDRMEERR